MIKSQSVKSEHPWIDNTRFEPLSQSEVLRGILSSVREETRLRTKHGGKPVKVVFDLDSTVFDVKPRTLRILKEFAQTTRSREISREISDWSMQLRAHTLLYTLHESALANQIPAEETLARTYLKEAFHYWKDRFFTHQYVTVDHPVPGAVDYVNQVVDAGATAIYLTGRDWPGMGKGTETMLTHWGFPVGPKVGELFMKPNAGMDDSEFKDEALREMRIEGNAVALFDNEPANFYVFERNFPEAWLVFYHSNCSNKEARPVKRIYKIENFLY